jgi:predicted Zn-dependent protease
MALRLLTILAVSMALLGSAPRLCAQFGKPNQNEQLNLGKRAAKQIRGSEKLLPSTDPRVVTVRKVASNLLRTFDDRDRPWEFSFDVIEGKEVNAFALPGGPMFVYTGLLDKIKTEDELAGVLGHELTHVRREHWAYQYRDQQQRNLGLTALLTILRANSDIQNLAGLSSEVLMDLPYSRGHETEADDGGYEMMVKAGYNPQGLADMFNALKESGGSKPPEFLSSHPAESSRTARIAKKIAESKQTFPPQRPLKFDDFRDAKQPA